MILTPDRIRTETVGPCTITIKEKIIPDSARSNKDQASYCKKGDRVKPCRAIGFEGVPLGICIHNTGDIKTPAATNPAEQYTRATWPNCNMGGSAVHFYVYDNEIWQNLSETERGWHAGDGSYRRVLRKGGPAICGNLDTVAIECIGNRPASEETTARLAAYLLQKYGLDPDRDLYTHRDFSGKNCPAYILPHWDAFFARVKEICKAGKAGEETASIPSEPFHPKAGEEVHFTGGCHYVSSTAPRAAGGLRRSCRARLTRVVSGAPHPYHLIASDGSAAVYGWVNADCVEALK